MNYKEIERRLAEIPQEMDKEGADLDALEKEVRDLKEAKAKTEREEQRKANLRNEIDAGAGDPVFKPQPAKRSVYDISSKEYRNAWAKSLLQQSLTAEDQHAINDVNQRALGTALTMTDETFVAPSSGADGINNGGLFIPKEVSDRLLSEITLDSPILGAVSKMYVKGMVSFPYKVQSTGAEWQKEGVSNNDESIEWATLTFSQKELSKTIRITWKLEAMAVDSFVDYIIRELRREMVKALAGSVPYGSGNLDVMGMVNTNLKVTYTSTDNLIDKLIEAGATIPKEYRSGAKLYISDGIATKISLMKDTNGQYLLNPINGVGLSKLGRWEVAIDPYLNDNDFFLGNLYDGYILNEVEPVSITKDIHGKCRVNDYTAYAIYGGNVIPGRIVYGTMTP